MEAKIAMVVISMLTRWRDNTSSLNWVCVAQGLFTLPELSMTEVERVLDNMSLECLDWVSEDLFKEPLLLSFLIDLIYHFHCNHHLLL